jgi:hypothetical protein
MEPGGIFHSFWSRPEGINHYAETERENRAHNIKENHHGAIKSNPRAAAYGKSKSTIRFSALNS